QWYQESPHLFHKRPYDRPGCDTYGQDTLIKTLLPSSWQPPSKPLKVQSTAREIPEIMLG
ncbi:hypothetical protein, partial [Ottowia pentelensis]